MNLTQQQIQSLASDCQRAFVAVGRLTVDRDSAREEVMALRSEVAELQKRIADLTADKKDSK